MLKVGDTVVCLDDCGIKGLVVGKEYIVCDIRATHANEYYVMVEGVLYWLIEEKFKLYEGEEKMELKDIIKVGYLVETRVGGCYIALQNQEDIVVVNETDFNYIKNEYFYKGNEIIKVWGLPTQYYEGLFSTEYRDLIWEREKRTEMTIAEIEDKLGIKGLKIVKE